MNQGVIITKGLQDWEILQQNKGKGVISLSGIWNLETKSDYVQVYVRIVEESTGEMIGEWYPANMNTKNGWSIVLNNVPAGGLYRIETSMQTTPSLSYEWNIRGDMIHHIGVGDVWVIAGQSNSAGYGKDAIYDPPELGVHLFKNSGRWDLATHPMNDSTNTIHPVNLESANSGHSLYLSFAKYLKRNLNYPIGMVQTSLGGSKLSAWNPEESGELYENMIRMIELQSGGIKGIIWYQGCSDTSTEVETSTYKQRFEAMVSRLRENIKNPDALMITVQLNRSCGYPEENERWTMIREAQRCIANSNPKVYIVPAIDCELSDGIHNSATANLMLGERVAKLILQKEFGYALSAEAPDIEDVKMIKDTELLITYKNVRNRLYTYEVPADRLPYTIIDEGGNIKIKEYSLKEHNQILLELERTLGNEAYLYTHYGQNPRGMMIIDFSNHLPILASIVKIELE